MAFTDLFKSKNKASNGKCPAHTRRPWGSPQHEYSKSVRNFLMGLLLLVVISVFVTAAVVVGLNHSKDCDGLQIQGWNGFQQNGCEGRQSSNGDSKSSAAHLVASIRLLGLPALITLGCTIPPLGERLWFP